MEAGIDKEEEMKKEQRMGEEGEGRGEEGKEGAVEPEGAKKKAQEEAEQENKIMTVPVTLEAQTEEEESEIEKGEEAKEEEEGDEDREEETGQLTPTAEQPLTPHSTPVKQKEDEEKGITESKLEGRDKDVLGLCLGGWTDIVDRVLSQIQTQNVDLIDLELIQEHHKTIMIAGKVKDFFQAIQYGCAMKDIRVPELCLSIGKQIFEDLDFEEKMKAVEAVYEKQNEMGQPLQNLSHLYPKYSAELTSVLNNEVRVGSGGNEGRVRKVVGLLGWSFLLSLKTTLWHCLLLALSHSDTPPLIAQILRLFPPLGGVLEGGAGEGLLLVAVRRLWEKGEVKGKEENFLSLILALSRQNKSAPTPLLDPTTLLHNLLIPAIQQTQYPEYRNVMLKVCVKVIKSNLHPIRWKKGQREAEVWEGDTADKKEDKDYDKLQIMLPAFLVTLGDVYLESKGKGNNEEAMLALKGIHATIASEGRKGDNKTLFPKSSARWMVDKFSNTRWELKFLLTMWLRDAELESENEEEEVFVLQVPQCLFTKLPSTATANSQFKAIKCVDHDEEMCVLSSLVDLTAVGEVAPIFKVLFGKEVGDLAGGFVETRKVGLLLQQRLPSATLEEWRRFLLLIDILQPIPPSSHNHYLALFSQPPLEAINLVNSVAVLTDAVASLMSKRRVLGPDAPSPSNQQEPSGETPTSTFSILPRGPQRKDALRMLGSLCVLLKESVESIFESKKTEKREGENSGLDEKIVCRNEAVLLLVFRMGTLVAKAFSALYSQSKDGEQESEPNWTPDSIRTLLTTVAQKHAELNVQGIHLTLQALFPPHTHETQPVEKEHVKTLTTEGPQQDTVDVSGTASGPKQSTRVFLLGSRNLAASIPSPQPSNTEGTDLIPKATTTPGFMVEPAPSTLPHGMAEREWEGGKACQDPANVFNIPAKKQEMGVFTPKGLIEAGEKLHHEKHHHIVGRGRSNSSTSEPVQYFDSSTTENLVAGENSIMREIWNHPANRQQDRAEGFSTQAQRDTVGFIGLRNESSQRPHHSTTSTSTRGTAEKCFQLSKEQFPPLRGADHQGAAPFPPSFRGIVGGVREKVSPPLPFPPGPPLHPKSNDVRTYQSVASRPPRHAGPRPLHPPFHPRGQESNPRERFHHPGPRQFASASRHSIRQQGGSGEFQLNPNAPAFRSGVPLPSEDLLRELRGSAPASLSKMMQGNVDEKTKAAVLNQNRQMKPRASSFQTQPPVLHYQSRDLKSTNQQKSMAGGGVSEGGSANQGGGGWTERRGSDKGGGGRSGRDRNRREGSAKSFGPRGGGARGK